MRHHGQSVTAIFELIDQEFGPKSGARALVERATASREYDPAAARMLLSAARGESDQAWSERRLAVLLLENQMLRCPAEAGAILREIGADETAALGKMNRLRRAHEGIARDPDCLVAWRYFLRVARDVSKLHLARFVFTAEEVAAEVRRQLAISRGAQRRNCAPVAAPSYEAAILDTLCAGREIYWVSERCGSELNALVEFPLTTAVVVVKPPGSEFEIEFKRAGVRGPKLLDVIAERNGREAPVSHRLFGGSLGWLGEREGAAAALFDRIYRLVHGAEAPCSQSVRIHSIVSVPDGGDKSILDYLDQSPAETRRAMEVCVREFPSDTGVLRASYEGERGVTLQFIGQALPQQAVIFGSSSFRLDRIALYLSEAGADSYFREGYTIADARWFADSVLEEILGEIEIPAEPYVDYARYVRAAFAVPANRQRADLGFLSTMRQLGECWGTLLAVRGFSDGESFVQRNVGVKSRWRDGAWRPQLVFMDHDDLTMAGSRYGYLWPQRELAGSERDQIHILGGSFGDDHPVPGSAAALRAIFRVSAATAEDGARALEAAIVGAYRTTQERLDSDPELRSLFYPQFLDHHRDLDRLAGTFLETAPGEEERWKVDSEAFLRSRGYDRELITEHLENIPRRRTFLERMRFLYR